MKNRISQAGATAVIDPQEAEMTPPGASTTSKQLKELVQRRHPQFEDHLTHWAFLEATYDGGREWFKENIFRYIKEGDSEFKDRVERAYRFNHTREVVDLINKYLFKQNIVRNEEDAPESVKKFWKRSTRNGMGISDFSRQISRRRMMMW